MTASPRRADEWSGEPSNATPDDAVPDAPPPRSSDLGPDTPERIASATAASGIDVIVSTRRRRFEVPDPLRTSAIDRIEFPIEPGRPPPEPEIRRLVDDVVERLRAGASVAIACWTGAERSAVVAAAVCVRLGLDPSAALSHVERSRGVRLAITPAQRVWLDGYAARLTTDALS